MYISFLWQSVFSQDGCTNIYSILHILLTMRHQHFDQEVKSIFPCSQFLSLPAFSLSLCHHSLWEPNHHSVSKPVLAHKKTPYRELYLERN